MLKLILLFSMFIVQTSCGGAETTGKVANADSSVSGSEAVAVGSNDNLSSNSVETSRDDALDVSASPEQAMTARGAYSFNTEHPFLTIESGGNLSKVRDVIFTRDGRYIVSVGYDKVVRIHKSETGEHIRTLRGQIGPGREGRIFAAALSPDENTIALGGWLGTYTGNTYRENESSNHLRLVDFYTGEVRALLAGHRDVILSLSYSPDGNVIVSGSGDHDARVWDSRSGRSLYVLTGHSGPVLDTAIAPNGRTAVTASADRTLRLWDLNTGRNLAVLSGHRGKVTSVAYTPDSSYIVSGSSDGEVRLWDGYNGNFVKTPARINGGVASISVLPNSPKVVVTSSGSSEVSVISIRNSNILLSFRGHENVVLASAVSPDGRTVATAGGNNHEILLWDADSGYVRRKISGKGRTVWSVGFAKDGSSIAFGNELGQKAGQPYQINGPLNRVFRIVQNDNVDLGLVYGSPNPSAYRTAAESAAGYSVRTQNGKEHSVLEIIRNGRVQNRVSRNATSGFDHRAFSLTPQGDMVVSGGSNGYLASYRTDSGVLNREYIGHTGDILAVALSPDGSLLVSGSNDQTIRLWKTHTGELLLTAFIADDNQWIAWTPQGYYASSVYGDKYVGWHINRGSNRRADYYPAHVFSSRFRSSSLVSYYLDAGGAFTEAVRRYKQSGESAYWEQFSNITDNSYYQLADLAPPSPVFIYPYAYTSSVQTGSIRIKARAVSSGAAPIEEIVVMVNGRQVSDNGPVKPKGSINKRITDEEVTVEVEVPLPEISNRISVIAKNRFASSEPTVIDIERREERVEKGDTIYKPNLYLLAVGVSENRDPDYVLRYAHADAESIDEAFRAQADKLYRNVNTRLLTNSSATRANILDGLNWIYRQATQRDTAVIFIAGHGLKDDRNNYYFLPYDGEAQALHRSGVKWEEFKNVIENLPARVILMADTCFSGNITGTHRGPKNTMDDAIRDLVNSGTGAVVFTASTGRQLGYEHPDWKHGAFTKAMIEGLSGRKADYNKDGHVYIKEINLYVSERVKNLTGGAQHPTTEIPSTMPDFPLYSI